jgi:hypothetical protein
MKYRCTFEPLQPDAVAFLEHGTGLYFSHLDFGAPNWLCVTARLHGSVCGVLVAEFMVWYEAHLTCVISDPRFMTRRLMHAIFSTLFSRAVRVTGMCRPENDASIRLLRHLGCKYEGCLRMGIDGRWDGLIFGMLRNECRWIRAPKEAPDEIAKAA